MNAKKKTKANFDKNTDTYNSGSLYKYPRGCYPHMLSAIEKTAKAITRLIALIVLLCLISIPLFTEAFIVTHAAHDCHGEVCPICVQIHNAELLLERCGKVTGILLSMGICLFFVTIVPILRDIYRIYTSTLVDKKVRLNN